MLALTFALSVRPACCSSAVGGTFSPLDLEALPSITCDRGSRPARCLIAPFSPAEALELTVVSSKHLERREGG